MVVACLLAVAGSGAAQEIFSDGFESGNRLDWSNIVATCAISPGDIVIDRSVITNNIGGSWYPTYPQISNHSDTPVDATTSIIR